MKCPAAKRVVTHRIGDRKDQLSCNLVEHGGPLASNEDKLAAHPHLDWIAENTKGDWLIFKWTMVDRTLWNNGEIGGAAPSTYGVQFQLADDFLLYRTKFL